MNDRTAWAVFLIFLRLGLTSFGGPVAHLGYFHAEFVARRRWISERSYADLVALCQFLPGPASSQVGMALGLSRAGYGGLAAAWAGFTLPSALALVFFALGVSSYGDTLVPGALQGLKVVAVAVVAQAVWGMACKLCPDVMRVTMMAGAACLVLLAPSVWTQIGVIVAAGAAGLIICKPAEDGAQDALPTVVGRRTGVICLLIFFLMLIGLPVLNGLVPGQFIAMVDAFYRAGALVFGGGHVVLPLLQAEVVSTGWVDNDAFLAGYGAAQAVPGPLFTFAAFLGASTTSDPSGWLGALIALVAIFVPSFLLVIGALPFWEGLRRNARMQAALSGINAGVVGLLLAALYDPVWVNAIHRVQDFALAIAAIVALAFWRLPAWAVVGASGAVGWGLTML